MAGVNRYRVHFLGHAADGDKVQTGIVVGEGIRSQKLIAIEDEIVARRSIDADVVVGLGADAEMDNAASGGVDVTDDVVSRSNRRAFPCDVPELATQAGNNRR